MRCIRDWEGSAGSECAAALLCEAPILPALCLKKFAPLDCEMVSFCLFLLHGQVFWHPFWLSKSFQNSAFLPFYSSHDHLNDVKN